jgi:transcriptional regulator with XRE-family HTH domain
MNTQNPNDLELFGDRIYAARTAAGLTRRQLADRAGLTRATIASRENYVPADPASYRPNRPDNTDIVELLAQALGIAPAQLMPLHWFQPLLTEPACPTNQWAHDEAARRRQHPTPNATHPHRRTRVLWAEHLDDLHTLTAEQLQAKYGASPTAIRQARRNHPSKPQA